MLKEFIYFTVIINVCFAVCKYGTFDRGVSNEDMNTIVNKHNELRLLIANGQVAGQPKGINLKRISWDLDLANSAQNIANNCVFEHVSVQDNRWAVGQNIYSSYSTTKDDSGADWQGTIQSWFNENEKYYYPESTSSTTGHYTQVVWANTSFIGCGYTYYGTDDPKFKYQKFYVCNYGPAGNYAGQPPYKTGNSGCENLC